MVIRLAGFQSLRLRIAHKTMEVTADRLLAKATTDPQRFYERSEIPPLDRALLLSNHLPARHV
jgi:hypothetical protein